MARNRAVPNFLYGTLGLAVVGTATYFAVRAVRRRRHGEGAMLSVRRASRKAARAAKDTAQQVGTDIQRGASDTGDALVDVGNEFQSATTPSYGRV